MRKIFLIVVFVFVSISIYTFQCVNATPLKTSESFPFSAGESLTYEFKFSKFPIYGILGQIRMEVLSSQKKLSILKSLSSKLLENFSADSVMVFSGEAETKGIIPALFNLKIKNSFLSIVNAKDLGSIYIQKDISEGKRKKRQVGILNREKNILEITDTNFSNSSSTPNTWMAISPSWTSDLLSFWYILRTQQLETNKVIPMVISEAGNSYKMDVVVRKTEKLNLDVGKFSARCLQLKAYEAKFVRKKGDFLLWISDDKLRLPLKVKFKTNLGTVTGELIAVNSSQSK